MGFLDVLFADPLLFIFLVAAVLLAVTVHEFAHALIADKLGDPTARLEGRLSLNPLVHLDPIGSLALLLLGIGWGKPVPIDPFNLKDPRRDSAIISLSGPASNLLVALLLSFSLRIIEPANTLLVTAYVSKFIVFFVQISVGLAIFNLIPIPPLDGSKILFGLLEPAQAAEWEEALNRYGLIILLFLLFPIFGSTPLVNILVMPIINFILSLILPATIPLV